MRRVGKLVLESDTPGLQVDPAQRVPDPHTTLATPARDPCTYTTPDASATCLPPLTSSDANAPFVPHALAQLRKEQTVLCPADLSGWPCCGNRTAARCERRLLYHVRQHSLKFARACRRYVPSRSGRLSEFVRIPPRFAQEKGCPPRSTRAVGLVVATEQRR